MFLPVAGSKLSGRFCSWATMFRVPCWPHCGRSAAMAAAAAASVHSKAETVHRKWFVRFVMASVLLKRLRFALTIMAHFPNEIHFLQPEAQIDAGSAYLPPAKKAPHYQDAGS